MTSDVEKLLKLTDLVLLDIKHIDEDWHKKITNHSNNMPIKFAKFLEDNNIKFWIRYVLVPGLSDQEEHLRKFCSHFQQYKNLERVEILPYHTLGITKYKELGMKYSLDKTEIPNDNLITKTKHILEENFKMVVIR
jgi:pyruvate formate lyase activating enzyme